MTRDFFAPNPILFKKLTWNIILAVASSSFATEPTIWDKMKNILDIFYPELIFPVQLYLKENFNHPTSAWGWNRESVADKKTFIDNHIKIPKNI